MSLERFVLAQRDTWETALAELQQGEKRSHWMWFIFPQLRSLGGTERATFYGIADLAEAQAYLAHPVLGPRLVQAAETVLRHGDRTAVQIMGAVDAMKLRSCATLFARAGGSEVFERVIKTFYNGPDPSTLEKLGPE